MFASICEEHIYGQKERERREENLTGSHCNFCQVLLNFWENRIVLTEISLEGFKQIQLFDGVSDSAVCLRYELLEIIIGR